MTKATITPHFSTSYEVGAILYDSWGCEQTNIDFYCIVERSGEWVKVQKMVSETIKSPLRDDFSMVKSVKPGVLTTEKPIRKKLKVFNGNETGFAMRNYSGGGWCSLWNGKEKTSTHY